MFHVTGRNTFHISVFWQENTGLFWDYVFKLLIDLKIQSIANATLTWGGQSANISVMLFFLPSFCISTHTHIFFQLNFQHNFQFEFNQKEKEKHRGTLFFIFKRPSINVTVCEALRWRPAKLQAVLFKATEEHRRELQQKQPVVTQENALNNRLLATAFSLHKTGIKTVLLCCWPVGEQQPLNSSQDTWTPAHVTN